MRRVRRSERRGRSDETSSLVVLSAFWVGVTGVLDDGAMERLSSIDLFAGADGLTLGLRRAGFDTVLVIDDWDPAVGTPRRNFGETAVSAGCVRELTARVVLARAGGEVPLLVAGGRRQGFTSAGARRVGDARNTLVGEFARVAGEMRPRWSLFENVEGMLTAADGDFVVDLLDGVLDAGYSLTFRPAASHPEELRPSRRARLPGSAVTSGNVEISACVSQPCAILAAIKEVETYEAEIVPSGAVSKRPRFWRDRR